MSSSSTTPAAAPSSNKPMRILACVLCQHRKIKCDRSFPCANCIKANVTCTPSTPAPARKRRRPNQDLQERLARCEELLKEYAKAKPDTSPSQPTPQIFDEDHLGWKPAGKLVLDQEDGAVRFMDSMLLGTVYDELKSMREAIDMEDNEDASPETTNTPDEHADLVMPVESPQTSLEELHPAPGHVFRLWQLYLERVNPLTKIIHVPTLQPYLVDATNGSTNIPKNVEALLFAIYTLATVSTTPDECLALLGYSRETALQRFSTGVRIALNRLGFLKSHDLETLQACVIYLISLQGRYNRHAAWILNGIVIRIAQKMGLHRDGEQLGLCTFETEMRRRLWWQIIMVDAKYAMISGLSHSLLPRAWDTKEPKNVNDADLFPSATEPVQDRDGPTEMIMVLITNRVAKFFMDTPGIEPMILLGGEPEAYKSVPGGPSTEQISAYKGLIQTLGAELLEIIEKFSDPSAGPLHEMAQDMKVEILEKIELLLMPQEKKYGEEIRTASDRAFKVAVQGVEHSVEQHVKTKDKGFAWFSRLHFQLNIFQYVVGQLCTRTTGELVEKAWPAVETSYDLYPDLFDITQKSYYQVARMMLKAWRIREGILRSRYGASPETPYYIAKLQSLMPQEEARSDPASGPATEVSFPIADDTMKIDGSADPFLEPYLDVNSIDWDVWGVQAGTAMTAFGGFGMGPNTEW